MDLWALQTSRLNPNPCPLPWVSDYKVIPASLSCGNWISLRDLWKLTSANAALLPATATLLTPPHPPQKKTPDRSFQNINESTIRLKKRTSTDSCICRLKSTSPVRGAQLETAGWARDGVYPQVRAACRGQPGCQVAPLPAGWARSNQGCGAQLELPTSAPPAHGWLKAMLGSASYESDLEERLGRHVPKKKKKGGWGGGQMETKEIGRLFNDGVKWTAHIPSINIAVGPLSTSHHRCHLSSPTASRVA